MLKKLQIKFVCINMVIVTVMICVIFGMVFRFTQDSLESQSLQMMQSIADDPFQLGRPNEQQDQLRLPYFTVQINPRGELIAASGGYYDLSDEALILQIALTALNAPEQTGLLSEYDLRFCKTTSPAGEIIVFADISSEAATLETLVRNCVLVGLLGFCVFLIISLLLARWAVKPVAQAWSQQKQFVADASHELKTPLTVIMTNAELMQDRSYEEAERQQFSSNILLMSQQMRGLVEGLLELARVDNGAVKMTFSEWNMSQLVSDGLLVFEALYFEKGLTLCSTIEENIYVRGSQAHVGQVLEILLDNAMKYSDPGTVQVRLKKQGAHCLLSVSNPGGEISREDLKNIFKRFYRVDKVRSRNGSYGLGLSIAQSIVREHRGRIWAESSGGSNRFYVQLPII